MKADKDLNAAYAGVIDPLVQQAKDGGCGVLEAGGTDSDGGAGVDCLSGCVGAVCEGAVPGGFGG